MLMDGYRNFLRENAYIGGEWRAADNEAVFPVMNPADGSVLGHVPNMGRAEAERAVLAAHAALPVWRGMLAQERAEILRKWASLIVAHADDLASLLSLEQGKPLAEARGEIIGGAGFVSWYAEEGRRVYGDTIPTHKADARILVTREAIGVVGAITPWNFPSSMVTRKLAPAFAAGCTAVLKPAHDTPFSALALAVLAVEAGMPAGVLNIVTGDSAAAAEIGQVLTTHPAVRKISFTGSTSVGKLLMAQASSTVKKISLELGGNAPFIIFDSADLDKAVEGVMASKFRNAGQTCISANRIYVQDGIYDEFAKRLQARVASLTVGAGMTEGVQVGPLINRAAIEKVQTHVRDALDKGAKLVTGGEVHPAGELFYAPTILTGMRPDMMAGSNEIFGPVAGLFRFKTEEEVIRLANDTQYGLASYFYTALLGQAFRVAEALEYGMVAVNESMLSYEGAPFGGIKESGMGREGSRYGIEDFLNIKYTLLGGL